MFGAAERERLEGASRFTTMLKDSKERSQNLHYNPHDTDGPKVFEPKKLQERGLVRTLEVGDVMHGFARGEQVKLLRLSSNDSFENTGVVMCPGALPGDLDVRVKRKHKEGKKKSKDEQNDTGIIMTVPFSMAASLNSEEDFHLLN